MAEGALIGGLVVAMVTPMTDDGEAVRRESVARLADALIRSGAEGLFVAGTTGETALLGDDERLAVAREALRGASGRVPVVVQATVETTRRSLDLARELRAMGVQGIALLAPGYYRYRDDELVEYFSAVAGAVPDLAVYLYNIPQRTGNPLSAAFVEQVVRGAPNVVGIKDSSGSMQQILSLIATRERLRRQGRRFVVLSGDDGLALPALCAGADGLVSGNATAVPEIFVELLRSVRSARCERARELALAIVEVAAILGNGARLDRFKAVVTRRGIPAGTVRPPARPGGFGEQESVWSELQEAFRRADVRLAPWEPS